MGAPDPADSRRLLNEALERLSTEETRALLVGAAHASPSLAKLILHQHQSKTDALRDRMQSYSKSVWYILNRQYQDMAEKSQHAALGEAYEKVKQHLECIALEASSFPNYFTKSISLITLRKIGKSISLMPAGTLRRGIQQRMLEERPLELTLDRIAQTLSMGECQRMAGPEGEGWISAMEELVQMNIKDAEPMLDSNVLEVIRSRLTARVA